MSGSRLLLFDIDGTLMTCQGRGLRAMHRAVQRVYGLQAVELSVQPHGKTDPMLFDEMAAGYRLPASRLAEHLTVLHDTYVAELTVLLREPGACDVKPGVQALLEALAARPEVTLGVVSGNLERTAWLKLEAAGLAAHFCTGAFGSDSRRRSDLVGLALRRCTASRGVIFEPDRVWVIGDTPDDVASGRAHGTRTLAVATGSFQRDVLERCEADAVLDSFADTSLVLDTLCSRR
jgi:phosphoglycolate phosphatase